MEMTLPPSLQTQCDAKTHEFVYPNFMLVEAIVPFRAGFTSCAEIMLPVIRDLLNYYECVDEADEKYYQELKEKYGEAPRSEST